MSEMTVSAACEDFTGAIERARRSGEPVYVTRRGHRLAVIVDVDTYDALVEAAKDTLGRADLARLAGSLDGCRVRSSAGDHERNDPPVEKSDGRPHQA